MFCSTIIPTVGRESLNKTVESVLEQKLPDDIFEVIIVNDSGEPLQKASWQDEERVQIVHTQHRERSVARNTGAAIAKGRYLHFLDDDDWLAPGAFQHLWYLSQTSNAKWLYGITELVDRDLKPILKLQHTLEGNCFAQVMAGEWIPLQSSIIDAQTFFIVGGFNPLLTGPEDIDLLRRIALIGEFQETPNLIAYMVRGEQGSTTNYQKHPEERRWAREKVLDAPDVFTRLRSSAKNSMWRGYTTRIYLTSVIWNLRDQRPLTAIDRFLYANLSIFLSGFDVLSKEFWSAVIYPYASITFRKGYQEFINSQ